MKAFSRFILSLSTLVVASFNADAFGVGQGIHRAAVQTNADRSSRPPVFGKNVPSVGIGGSSALQMASDTGGSSDQVVIDKDFRLAAIFLGGGLFLDRIPFLQVTIGPIVTLLGVLFLVQTFRLNFVCDDTTFSLQDTTTEENEVGENFVVGGENRWTYDSFVNYDFFPGMFVCSTHSVLLMDDVGHPLPMEATIMEYIGWIKDSSFLSL